MTENKGDLISRSALLKTFSNSRHIKETTSGLDVMEMLAIKEVIDNAPTVPLPDFKAGYKQAILDGQTNFKRLQGEWIKQYGKSYELKTNEGVLVGEFTKCPKCQYDKARGSNFCPNCGADMRGKEE